MTSHFATPGGAANSMGAKTSNAGIWGQATRNIKAGTAVKAESGFAPFPGPSAFPKQSESQQIGDALIAQGFTAEQGDEPGEIIFREPVAA